MINAVISPKKTRSGGHGGGVRGDNSAPRSALFEGRFGRMFRSLPAGNWSRESLINLGKAMTSDPETVKGHSNIPEAAFEDPKKRIHDDEENAAIPAGYTYFGQFLDHDITFDPASSLMARNDPDALVDYRTPRLDLDSLYGRGPADQPYMYVGNKFRLGRTLSENGKKSKSIDLPRFNDPVNPGAKRALIGDKRNDENVIVSQLHSAMLQFHNRLVDDNPDFTFEEIQQQVRWHYQWLVVNDFLKTICGKEVVEDILPDFGKHLPLWKLKPNFSIYKWRNDPFMPIEFSAAAYRFGHSMVRPIYRLNTELKGGDKPDDSSEDEIKRGLAGRFFIFAGVQARGLNGFDEFPDGWGIDWTLFFNINDSINNVGMKRVQPAYKIDTALVNPLGFLPEFSQPAAILHSPLTVDQLQSKTLNPKDPDLDPSNLAKRNLLRGLAMGLPSGQDVAVAMGLDPIDDKDLRVGKAVLSDVDKNPTLASLDPDNFTENAPLWYYVLAEAQHEWAKRAKAAGSKKDEEPVRLGTVGGRIVAETIIGLLWGDGHSYLRQAPNWSPSDFSDIGGLLHFALKLQP
jgi:hypothetical protein